MVNTLHHNHSKPYRGARSAPGPYCVPVTSLALAESSTCPSGFAVV